MITPPLGARHRVDERAEGEADQRVEERAGHVDRGEERGEREREGEADEDLLEHQPGEREDSVGSSAGVAAGAERDRRHADGERDGDDAARRGRASACWRRAARGRTAARRGQHEDEADDLLLAELREERLGFICRPSTGSSRRAPACR